MRIDFLLELQRAVSANRLAGAVAIAALLLASTGHASPLQSTVTSNPPTIDGTVGSTEWAGAGTFGLSSGTIYFENDGLNLYLLYDMTGDTTLDTTPPFSMDFFEIAFDVNGNGVGDPNVDVMYSTCQNGALSVRAFLINAQGCGWTGCQATTAVVGRGFGPSPASATNHVIFEVAIPFSEIQANAGQLLHVGLGYGSPTPSIDESVPANLCDFSSYLLLQLGRASIPMLGRTELALLALLLAGIGIWVVRRFSGA